MKNAQVELSKENVAIEVKLILLVSSYEQLFDNFFDKSHILSTPRIDTFIKGKQRKIGKPNIWKKIEVLINEYWDDRLTKLFVLRMELESYLIDKGVSIRNNIIHSGKDRMAIMNFYSNSEDEYYDDLNKVVVYYYYFLKFVLLQFLEVDLSEYIEETYIPTLIEYE